MHACNAPATLRVQVKHLTLGVRLVTEQHAEFWPGRRIVRSVSRYSAEELVGGGLPSRLAEKMQDHACNKYTACARTISAGVFTAVCGSCYRLLGFSMMEQAESPRVPFEIALCLDWENGFGQWDKDMSASA